MKFYDLIEAFSKNMGIDVPYPEDDGSYKFFVDDRFEVIFTPATSNSFILWSKFGSLPKDEFRAKDLLKNLLKINLSRMYFQDETITLDHETNDLLIFNRVFLDSISLSDFLKCFEDFLNSLEFWSNYISDFGKEDKSFSSFNIFFP